MNFTLYLIACAIGGYLLGSIPFGLLVTRIAGYGDIRKIGSGNIGATNVLRTGNKTLALLTMLFDIFKAAIASWLALKFAPSSEYWIFGMVSSTSQIASFLAGFAAILGHMFPVWLKFKGGKGVASACGLLLATCWPLALAAVGIWLFMAMVFRYSSLAALTAAAAIPFISFFTLPPLDTLFYTAIVLMVIIKHHANIYRLLHGQESKITFKKK